MIKIYPEDCDNRGWVKLESICPACNQIYERYSHPDYISLLMVHHPECISENIIMVGK